MRVLVVDDQMMIAFHLKRLLSEIGVETVGPFGTAEDALRALESEDVNFALLDINLGGTKTSEPLADALLAQRLPFAFVTGYGSSNGLADRFADISCYMKPVRKHDIVQAMADFLPSPS